MAAFAVLILATDAILRWAVRRTWAFVAACVLYAAVVVAANLVLDATVGHWPAMVVAVVGMVLLAVGTVLQWREARRGGLDDPIVGPLRQDGAGTRAAGGTGDGAGSGPRGALEWLTVLLFPVLTVLMIALGWVLDLMA